MKFRAEEDEERASRISSQTTDCHRNLRPNASNMANILASHAFYHSSKLHWLKYARSAQANCPDHKGEMKYETGCTGTLNGSVEMAL